MVRFCTLLLLLHLSSIVHGQALNAEVLSTVEALAGKSNNDRIEIAYEILRGAGFNPSFQRFEAEFRNNTYSGSNIITKLDAGRVGISKIVIGAHIDAFVLPDGKPTAGAIDNAAGSVVLMNLISRLQSRQLSIPLEFVLFDLEEIALLGSQHYLQETDTSNILAMINIDIVLSGQTILFGPNSIPMNQQLMNLSLKNCAISNLSCLVFPEMPPSDDISFRREGIPHISFAVLPNIQAHQLWLFVNGGENSGLDDNFSPEILSLIHTENDSIDLIEEQSLTLLLDHLESLVLELDTTLER